MPHELIELTLGNPAHGGACIAYGDDGQIYFVRGGAPGEKVVAKITSRQTRLRWAEVVDVINASPDRIADNTLPGADLSHITVAAGREWKTRVLLDQIRRVGSRELEEQILALGAPKVTALPGDELLAEREWGRRTRARFAVMPDGRLAVRKYRSDRLLPVDSYPLLVPVFADVFMSPQWHKRLQGDSEVMLVAPTGGEPLVVGENTIWNLEGDEASSRVQWSVGKYQFEVDARGFWQVHPQAPATLVDAVLTQSELKPGDNVIELYSGAGLFTYFLAAAVAPSGRVLSIEGSEQAVADAASNCGTLRGIDFFVGTVDGDAIKDLILELGNIPRSIILDPPRSGAGKNVTSAIGETGVKQVTLIACDPASAARDMENLRARGFFVANIEAFDLFPGTHHFEIVATLRR